ncbi:hypothetical protein BDK51DRAFT_41946 [Blyttiomyces helicus]|uniref:TRP C-terminal domain-containing protein n=1 Tax=Blyttiomyces helicus TaxID=388810 RepID=A0A4P9WBK8_9FUNG|nr:hypothetical protein BDK51DRAFT_41946 [Blyttiomyces helicus]|eukprot:RKO90009.1 hypothetical protein BDK51DRAFT_41946 [Blyttiomyces helicus]
MQAVAAAAAAASLTLATLSAADPALARTCSGSTADLCATSTASLGYDVASQTFLVDVGGVLRAGAAARNVSGAFCEMSRRGVDPRAHIRIPNFLSLNTTVALCTAPNACDADAIAGQGGNVSLHYGFNIPEPDVYSAALEGVRVELSGPDGDECFDVTLENHPSTSIGTASSQTRWAISLTGTITGATSLGLTTLLSFLSPTDVGISLLDTLDYCQFVAQTGMLGLRYPDLYRGFTRGFGWSVFAWGIGAVDNAAARQRNVHGEDGEPFRGSVKPKLMRRAPLGNCSVDAPGVLGSCFKSGDCCAPDGSSCGAVFCGLEGAGAAVASGGDGGGPTSDGDAATATDSSGAVETSGPGSGTTNITTSSTASQPTVPGLNAPTTTAATTTTSTPASTTTSIPTTTTATAMPTSTQQATTASKSGSDFFTWDALNAPIGLEAFAQSLGLEPGNLMLVVAICFAMVWAAVLVGTGAAWACGVGGWSGRALGLYLIGEFVRGRVFEASATVRLGTVGLFILVATSSREVARSAESSSTRVIGGGILAVSLAFAGAVAFNVLKVSPPETLWNDDAYLITLGSLFSRLRLPRYRTFLLTILHRLLTAFTIGLLEASPWTQLTLLALLELAQLTSAIILRPRASTASNATSACIMAARVVSAFLLIAFKGAIVGRDQAEHVAWASISIHLAVFAGLIGVGCWGVMSGFRSAVRESDAAKGQEEGVAAGPPPAGAPRPARKSSLGTFRRYRDAVRAQRRRMGIGAGDDEMVVNTGRARAAPGVVDYDLEGLDPYLEAEGVKSGKGAALPPMPPMPVPVLLSAPPPPRGASPVPQQQQQQQHARTASDVSSVTSSMMSSQPDSMVSTPTSLSSRYSVVMGSPTRGSPLAAASPTRGSPLMEAYTARPSGSMGAESGCRLGMVPASPTRLSPLAEVATSPVRSSPLALVAASPVRSSPLALVAMSPVRSSPLAEVATAAAAPSAVPVVAVVALGSAASAAPVRGDAPAAGPTPGSAITPAVVVPVEPRARRKFTFFSLKPSASKPTAVPVAIPTRADSNTTTNATTSATSPTATATPAAPTPAAADPVPLARPPSPPSPPASLARTQTRTTTSTTSTAPRRRKTIDGIDLPVIASIGGLEMNVEELWKVENETRAW